MRRCYLQQGKKAVGLLGNLQSAGQQRKSCFLERDGDTRGQRPMTGVELPLCASAVLDISHVWEGSCQTLFNRGQPWGRERFLQDSFKNPIVTSLNKTEKILTWVTKTSRGMLVFKFSWIEGLKAVTVHLLPWLFLSLCVATTPRQAFPFDCKMEVMNSWLHPSSLAMSTEKELLFFNSSSRSPRTDGHWPIHGSRAHLQKKPCGHCRSSLWLEVSVLDYVQKSIGTSSLDGRWRKVFLEKVAFEECISQKLGVVNDRDSTQAGLNRNIGIYFLSCKIKKKERNWERRNYRHRPTQETVSQSFSLRWELCDHSRLTFS